MSDARAPSIPLLNFPFNILSINSENKSKKYITDTTNVTLKL